jgi:Bifunctional DNA primase/polymerase, N-terminal
LQCQSNDNQISPFAERAALGIKYGIAVIPLGEISKATIPAGPGSTSATLDPDQIPQWSAMWPNANCGFVAQAKLGGKLIIDIDSKEALRKLVNDTGRRLPQTLKVKSGSPDAVGHAYFNQTEESLRRLRNLKVEKDGHELLSCRFNNQYCVGPLSIYEGKGVERINRGALYEVVDASPCADMSSWLIDWLLAQVEEGKITGTGKVR